LAGTEQGGCVARAAEPRCRTAHHESLARYDDRCPRLLASRPEAARPQIDTIPGVVRQQMDRWAAVAESSQSPIGRARPDPARAAGREPVSTSRVRG
jgi:hypothetical protein